MSNKPFKKPSSKPATNSAPAASPATENATMTTATATPSPAVSATPAPEQPKRKGRQKGQKVAPGIRTEELIGDTLRSDSLEDLNQLLEGKPVRREHVRRAIADLTKAQAARPRPRNEQAINLLKAYAQAHGYSAESQRGFGGGAVKTAPKIGDTRTYRTVRPKKGGIFARVAWPYGENGFTASFEDGRLVLTPKVLPAKEKPVKAEGVLFDATATA